MRRPPKIKKGRCINCGKVWIAKMIDYGANVAVNPCPYCNIKRCVMDCLEDHVIGTSAMNTEDARIYVETLETQNECELAVREEIFGRKKKARHAVLKQIMLRYDYLDETGVTDRGAPRLTPKELIKHYLADVEEEEPAKLTPKQFVAQCLEAMDNHEHGTVRSVIEALIRLYGEEKEKEGDDDNG